MKTYDTVQLVVALVLLAGFLGFGGWTALGFGGRYRRYRAERQLRAEYPMAFKSCKIDFCEPGDMLGGTGTRFGTITFDDGTKIHGALYKG